MKLSLRILILLVLGGAWVFSLLQLDQLKFQMDFERYFPKNDPAVDLFNDFKDDFGPDNDFFQVAFQREKGVFDSIFLQQFYQFSEKSKDLNYIQQSQSLTNLRYPVKTPLMLRYEPFLNYKYPKRYGQDAERIFGNDQMVGNFISKDTTILVVSMRTKGTLSFDESTELVNTVKLLVGNFDQLSDYHILGIPFIQVSSVQMQKRELTVSLAICFLLMIIIIWVLYQKVWPIIITSIGLGLSIVIFLGYLAMTGEGGDELIALYPVIVIIVGISDIIHVISMYIEELKAGKERREALKITLKEIGLATLITSLTTAAGFASLLVTDVDMVQIFGVNSAIGVIMTYTVVMLYLVAILPYFGAEDFLGKKRSKSVFWKNLLNRVNDICLNQPKKVTAITLFITLISIIGIFQISTNHKFLFNLPKRAQVTKDFKFFENKLNGFRPLEVVIKSEGDEKVMDFEFVAALNKIENHLLASSDVAIVNSIPTLYKSIGQNIKGRSNLQSYEFPSEESRFDQLSRFVKLKAKKDQLVADSLSTTHISAIIKDVGADNIKATVEELSQWIETEIKTVDISYFITGTGLLVDKNIEYVRQSILQGLLLAIGVVALLLGIIFKNIKMVIVGILPNIFPLLVTAALVGFLGIELEISVGIVFVVAFGIAVDDTIHFLTKYKLCRRKLGVDDSIKKTIDETGKAIVLTSIILFFAFFSLVFSVFPPSTVIGVLVSLTLLGAVMSNMFLLPVILRFFDHDK